ncbi:MAG: phosphoribosylglycinamide synthetase [Neisseria sp.]|uniref:phosphoribosylglycinamide synthetase n=1 Tax=Neisseria sp. TaxID=192066 RepID=UPI0026DCAB63|nr:phosphoribosylglycinamide synthetase [Neisseria sp.]MDO4249374.1 phosphoribosylglycinamide synthetase [Neisseria sp.]
MRLQILAVFTLTALAGLAACQKEATPASPAQQAQQQAPAQTEPAAQAPAQTEPAAQAPQQTAAPTSGESLIREPVAVQSQPVQAIQTKTFGEYTIHLTKAKVVGQILSVEFIAVPPKGANGEYKGVSGKYFPLKDFDYIDETTSKKVTLLQDEHGKYMANPLSGDKELRLQGHQRFPQTLTLKFPAPPETSPTITIDFPEVGSFESVPVSR